MEVAHEIMADDMAETLRKRLEAAIEFRSTTARALSLEAGLGETAVRDILKGLSKDVRLGTVERLASALRMSVADLLPQARQASEHPMLVSASRDDGAIAIRSVDLGYAMGSGREMSEYPDEMPVLFDPGFIRSITRSQADRLFVAHGDGDSMFPTLVNGDQVIIDTSQRDINAQDRIWALSLHGAGMIKRLRRIGPDRVRIISDNSLVPPEEVDASEIHIAGRVIWIGRKV